MDSLRTVRAAAVQTSPGLFSRDGTTEKVGNVSNLLLIFLKGSRSEPFKKINNRSSTAPKVLQAIANAAQAGTRLVYFPKSSFSTIPLFSLSSLVTGKAHMRLGSCFFVVNATHQFIQPPVSPFVRTTFAQQWILAST
jgi:hypothetical protein